MSLYMFRALNAHLQEDTLYTCSVWYCQSLREFVVACRCTVGVRPQRNVKLRITSVVFFSLGLHITVNIVTVEINC